MMEKAARCFLLLLFFTLPYTIQYSLVVNDSEEVFTIEGQVFSSVPDLECHQGVRCSSPEGGWATCQPAEEDCGNLDWQGIDEKVVAARKKLNKDKAEVEGNVKKVEKNIKRTVQEIDDNLKKKLDRVNAKIKKIMKQIKLS